MTRMRSMKLVVCTVLAAILAAPAVVYGGDDDDEVEFKAKLSGSQEVPPVISDTSGRFTIEFDRALTVGEYRLRVNDGERVTQAHLHCAPSGANGPIVVFLAGFHALGWDVDGKWIGNASISDANIIQGVTCPEAIADLADLTAAMDSGNIYVNVHTVANPGGEVRGQLVGEDDD